MPVGIQSRKDLSDAERIQSLLGDHDFTGYMDLAYLSKISRVHALFSKLGSLDFVEGIPFPASLALVRTILAAHAKAPWHQNDLAAFSESVRFGVYAAHLPFVQEVSYQAMQATFSGLRFRCDLERVEETIQTSIRSQHVFLVDWRGYEFYSIPAPISDQLWDLFRMDESPTAIPSEWDTNARIGTRQRSLRPILVAASRNRERLRLPNGAVVPAYGMGHYGAQLHLSVLIAPRYSSNEIERMLQEAFPVLLPGIHSKGLKRPLVGGEAWIVATYEPPPMVQDLANPDPDLFLGFRGGSLDPWVAGSVDENEIEER